MRHPGHPHTLLGGQTLTVPRQRLRECGEIIPNQMTALLFRQGYVLPEGIQWEAGTDVPIK